MWNTVIEYNWNIIFVFVINYDFNVIIVFGMYFS